MLIVAGCGRSEQAQTQNGAPRHSHSARPNEPTSDHSVPDDSSPPRAIDARSSSSYLRFDRGVIVDATGFAQPIAAASLFIPHGWRTEGGIVWGSQFMCTNGYNFEWSATAPDGSSGLAILPQMKWENNDYGAGASTPGCSSAPYTSVRDYAAALAANAWPGAQVIDYRDRPDILKELGAAGVQSTQMPMGENRTWTEAGEVQIRFEQKGRPMRGAVAAAVFFNVMTTDYSSIGGSPNGQTRLNALSAFANPAWFAYGPEDGFNPAIFEAIRRSIKLNPRWSSAIANHNTQIGRVAIEESRKRAAMISQNRSEIAQIQQQVWEDRQESADRRAREFGEAIKGVETYADADAPGGQVELSHNYDHAWRLNDGTYVLSDRSDFDPWRDLQLEGTKLEAAR